MINTDPSQPCAYHVVQILDRLLSFSPISCTLSHILSVSLEHRDQQTLDHSSRKLTPLKLNTFTLYYHDAFPRYILLYVWRPRVSQILVLE